MKLMYQCGKCREEGKRGFRDKWNFTAEEQPDKRCPIHQRVLHDIYVDRKGEEHTLDRWDVSVFRAIIGDITEAIIELQEAVARLSGTEAE